MKDDPTKLGEARSDFCACLRKKTAWDRERARCSRWGAERLSCARATLPCHRRSQAFRVCGPVNPPSRVLPHWRPCLVSAVRMARVRYTTSGKYPAGTSDISLLTTCGLGSRYGVATLTPRDCTSGRWREERLHSGLITRRCSTYSAIWASS